MSNIEFVSAKELFSSKRWSNFFVIGLEKWRVAEDFPENSTGKQYYCQGYVCLSVPEGIAFAIIEKSGGARGPEKFKFRICVSSDEEENEIIANRGKGLTRGNFKIVCAGETYIKASRLQDWWNKSDDHSVEFALHCANHISRRGLKDLPPMTPTHTPLLETKIKLLEAIANAASGLLYTAYELSDDSSTYGVDRDYIVKLRDCLRRLKELE